MKMKLFGMVLALSCCVPSGLNADFQSTFDEAFLICSSAAKAVWEYTKKPDWEYTKWGMTPQQVVRASNNLATEASDLRPDSDGNVTKLVAPYNSGRFSFQARFEFNAADRLSAVTLLLTDKSSCYDLQVSVQTAYGPVQGGTSTSLYIIENWQDQKNKNRVTYTALYKLSDCYVHYSGIKSAGAD